MVHHELVGVVIIDLFLHHMKCKYVTILVAFLVVRNQILVIQHMRTMVLAEYWYKMEQRTDIQEAEKRRPQSSL